MEIIPTTLSDLWVIKPTLWEDKRGYFFESFNSAALSDAGIQYNWVQDNEAMSHKGVTRGLHYQCGRDAQAKLVRVVRGRVLDIAVDLRPESATYGQHYSIELTGNNKLQMVIPRGFAHGYQVLEDHTIFAYKCDNYYAPKSEGGIYPGDPSLAIPWKLPMDQWILSDKDRALPHFPHHRPIAL